MKKILTASSLIIAGMSAFAQSTDIYSPGTLPAGAINQTYPQTQITFTVPPTAEVSTSGFGIPNIPGIPVPTSVSANVTSTALAVTAPAGLTAVFDQTDGIYNANESGTLTITGTPTASGALSLVITSATTGTASVLGQSISFGSGQIPPAPQVFDKTYTINVSGSAGIEDLSKTEFSVIQNMPNPFSGITKIAFSTPAPSKVWVKVFDLLGKEISNQTISAKSGINEVEFDGSNLKDGVYFYSVTNGAKIFTQKMQVRK